MIQTIVFDFFRVISTPPYSTVFKKYIPEIELQVWRNKLDELDLGVISEEDLVGELSRYANVSTDQIWSEIDSASNLDIDLLNFIENELKPKYKIGLLTNAPRSLVEKIVSKEKLKLFDIVLISSDLKLIKPDPEIFKVTIDKCGCLPQEILFIDDTEKNIEVAKSLGLNGIVYTDFDSLKKEIQTYL